MVIPSQTPPVDPATVAAASSTSGASASTSTSPDGGLSSLSNESTFLQLLVSQIKNQDPLNPTDSTQFLSQLTALSQLEQLTAIRQDADKGATPGAAGSTSSGTPATN